MKISVILFVGLVVFLHCNQTNSGQPKPEKVYRIVYEIMPDEWYKQQAELWQIELEKNPKNAEVWYNYYNANRYAHFENIDTEAKKQKLAKIIEDMGQTIPESYEYILLKYWNSYDMHDMTLVEKAYAMQPDRPDTYYPFISYYETHGNDAKVTEFCQKLYQSQDISSYLLNYNYNTLISLDPNAILITNGDNDTYPAWVVQRVKGVRPDVTVVNISLSTVNNYLEAKMRKRGISLDVENIKTRAKAAGSFSKKIFIDEFRKQLLTGYPKIPLYYAVTVYQPFLEEIKEDLYVIGLAYRYSSDRFDNLAVVRKNLEKNYRLDFLRYDWYSENAVGKNLNNRMNMNYVVPMVMLAEHYQSSSELKRADEWFDFAAMLAERAGNSQALEDIAQKRK